MMPGFVSSLSNSNEAVFANNADFSGSSDPSEANGLQTNGQLWIGATTANIGGTHINIGHLTSPNNSITFGYSSPNITAQVTTDAFIQTITGDIGSITGNHVTIYTNNASLQGGSSVLFNNSGTVSTLQITDSLNNTLIGKGSGNLTLTGFNNTGVGQDVLASITNCQDNTGVGNFALQGLTTGVHNCAIGGGAARNIVIGDQNTCLGAAAGINLTTDSSNNILIGYNAGSAYNSVTGNESNICIGNAGVGTDHVITIGTNGSGTGQQSSCYIAGIVGNTVSNQEFVTINSSTGQLGVTSSAGFSTVNVQTFTSNGTYTPTAGMKYCTIEVVGGGGGAGGCPITNDISTFGAASGGGGGGGYARKTVNAATIGVSQSVTVGGGGAGGSNTSTGTGGGTSSLGAIVTATGGSGSVAATESGTMASSPGAVGGVGGSGDFNANGSPGGASYYTGNIAAVGLCQISGVGGSSIFGGGGLALSGHPITPSNGNAGTNYGSGGSGAASYNTASTFTGGAGSPGIVIITEYI